MSYSNNSSQIAYSFYIPRILSNYTEQNVCDIFEQEGIGMVQRVDFTPINPRPGFGVNVSDVVRSAFVHFTTIYSTEVASHIVSILETGEAYKFYINNRNYLLLLKNRAPVAATMMNIHQVVDNCRVLEESIAEKSNSTEKRFEEQATRIAQLEDTVAKQSVDIDRLQQTIYQMLGGLYCQQTQGDEINALYDFMMDGKLNYYQEEYEYEQKENPSQRLSMDDLSVSTHSSMPSLVSVKSEDEVEDDLSVSTHSSMPSLVSVSSDEEYEVEDGETASTNSSDLTWLVENVLDEQDDYEVPVIEDEDSSKGSNDSLAFLNLMMSQRMRFTAELCDNN
jgi:hypothetical protein